MSILGILVRHRLRRDRWQLAIWVSSTGFLAWFTAAAIASTYGDLAGREAILRLAVSNPAILMLRGLPRGASLDAFVFFQIFTYLALMAALMSTFLAVRHTRAEEETGRAELIAATPAARIGPTVATAIHGVLANVAVGLAVVGGFAAGRLDPYGSLVAGSAVAATGVSFLAAGLLAAQVMRTSRGANGIAAAAVGAAFLLRGVGDAAGTPAADGLNLRSSWISWVSPIGWSQHSDAFTANSWPPLLLNMGLAGVAGAALFALQARRDSGASLLTGRPGRVAAGQTLSSPLGLFWRQSTATIVGWCLGAAVTGVLAGTLAQVVVRAISNDSSVSASLQRMVPNDGASMEQLLVAAMFSIVGVLAAICGAQVIMRMRQDEAGGTAELVLATPYARVRWLADYLMLGVAAVGLVLLTAAVASSVAGWVANGDRTGIGTSFAAAAAQLPAALIYLGALALIFVVLPRATIGLGWALIAAGVFLGVFGSLSGIPGWVVDLAPFSHTPVVVGGATDWSGGFWMLAIAVATALLALRLMVRRELLS